MAYPELGAGQPDGLGFRFGASLGQYSIWSLRRSRGLNGVREIFADPNFQPPRLRDFRGTVERGRRRLRRRFAAYDVYGNQTINGFLNAWLEANRIAAAGTPQEAYEVASPLKPIRQEIRERNTPSARRIVKRDIARWSERFDLHQTGASADPEQKAKDLISRGVIQSRPVLHMAHGLNQILAENDWLLEKSETYDWLLVFVSHAESWIWRAIEHANSWRSAVHWERTGKNPISAEQMIELVLPPRMCGKMPPA